MCKGIFMNEDTLIYEKFNFTKWLFSEVHGNESDCLPFFQRAKFHQNSEVAFCCYKQPSRVKKVISLSKVTVQAHFYLGIPWGGGGGTGIKHTHMHTRGKDAVQKRERRKVCFLKLSWDSFMSFSPSFWMTWSSANGKVYHVQFRNTWGELDQSALSGLSLESLQD